MVGRVLPFKNHSLTRTRLIAVNVVSLVFALIANISLLMNMARRLSFAIAQPITILGFYLASFLLIALIAVASNHLHAPGVRDQALTQAYYYAIFAAGIYFIISSLMVITVYGATEGHYPKNFELTMSQRTLMLQTISFMVYMLAGAAVYAHIEQWKFLDAVYWADFTLLTIGIGDYAPSTHLGRGLLFPYAIGGIVILGLVVGSIRSLVLERGKKKMGARMTEKMRERVLKKVATSDKGKLKLDPIEEDQPHHSERRRREQEFNLMRKVQEMAATERKWMSLLISGGAWFVLWFVGAAVFWKAERKQDWSYFESLYFAYTSLLTIGYGDFRPYSNSGKPFFVFWSLLAVPTLTILISNMGDTIIKGIRDLTLYLGELTVLPGEAGPVQRMKAGVRKATRGKLLPGSEGLEGIEEKPPVMVDMPKQKGGPQHGGDTMVDRVAGVMEEEEKNEEEEARLRGDTFAEDIHHYHYLLVREMRNVYKDFNTSPTKKYTYDEWAYFLKLIGEDESSSRYHRAARIDAHKDGEDEPDMGKAKTLHGDDEVSQWSWMGNRSPLMGDKDEPVWVLERLSMTLEKELREQRMKNRKQGQEGGGLPESMSRGSSRTLEVPNGDDSRPDSK